MLRRVCFQGQAWHDLILLSAPRRDLPKVLAARRMGPVKSVKRKPRPRTSGYDMLAQLECFGEPCINLGLMFPTAQRLHRNPRLCNKSQNRFTIEHSANHFLPESSRILTRHSDPPSDQPATTLINNGHFPGVISSCKRSCHPNRARVASKG